jgi:hypothetical protein
LEVQRRTRDIAEQNEVRVNQHPPTNKERMDGKRSGNNFLLHSSFKANIGG